MFLALTKVGKLQLLARIMLSFVHHNEFFKRKSQLRVKQEDVRGSSDIDRNRQHAALLKDLQLNACLSN